MSFLTFHISMFFSASFCCGALMAAMMGEDGWWRGLVVGGSKIDVGGGCGAGRRTARLCTEEKKKKTKKKKDGHDIENESAADLQFYLFIYLQTDDEIWGGIDCAPSNRGGIKTSTIDPSSEPRIC
jgi:hypothetical protein